jgi:beta-xylosidase
MVKGESTIDNTLFVDDNGRAYIYYDRFNEGLNVWGAEVNPADMTILEKTQTACIRLSQAWERVWPTVNEGAFVIKHNGAYYMTYSANSYESPLYGVGYATAKHPLGPWTKYADNPILQSPGELVGVGHSSMFRDKAGQLRIVFHAHHSKDAIHPREMYISTVSFERRNGQEIMVISPDYLTPHLTP